MKKGSQILLGLVIASSILLIAAVPDWIQYNERVVGENSPYFTDVVNRPGKQIWANFTSQHDASGGHKASIFPTAIPTIAFPTPLPTATPVTIPTPLPTATPELYTDVETVNSLPATVGLEGCRGKLQIVYDDGTLTLPTATYAEANGCHTVRIWITNPGSGAVIVAPGSGTIGFLGGNATALTSTITPYGAALEFVYYPFTDQWLTHNLIGEWTPTF